MCSESEESKFIFHLRHGRTGVYMNLTLEDVLHASKGKALNITRASLRNVLQGVSIDSRKIQPGDLFFALKGERFDAHDFLDRVFATPNVAAVVGRSWAGGQKRVPNWPLVVVDDTLQALQEVGAFYRRKFNIPVLAITGSNGKTTTKEMTASVLAQKFRVVKTPGNLNNHIGLPLTLFEITSETEFAVVEMGANHFGEIARLCEIADPDFGLITNIGSAHLEYFGSVENVARAKSELPDYLSAKKGVLFVNQDDPLAREIGEKVKNRFTYGLAMPSDARGEFVSLDERGCVRFRLNGEDIHLNVPGAYQVQNALAASAVGLYFGLKINRIKQALESFSGVAKRMEIVKVNDILILNDTYNANLDSMKGGLKTLAHIRHRRGGRSFAVLADMLELGDESERQHRLVGEIAAEIGINFILTYGKQARFISDAAIEKGLSASYHFEKKEDLEKFLQSYLRGGDLVLVKGSRGMGMETVVQFLRDRYKNHSPNK
ncbi:UDP-N-acetylmuramoyl-tripeptide--D-alanyl-D-alanine ligase [bacterium BMS3Abin05]|nr:UDP-N-acetylmuramoyl-tripeptide--D-alanyl-D-alanine ligase [bacterium BMS3Abin05]GBE27084.1 UDP-N-acetylmuramoyl-tripeptide--D-alanyl-D-alanine ligase [bacterium BMS3Bbin03]HDZ11409.1 UDP-N-acetylmuramoyl-tripeptide--D-alanyl-D-alanine ligase [Bacteroidota bacterium]